MTGWHRRLPRVSFTLLFVISCPPIIRMAGKGCKCIKNCGRWVSHVGNTCGTCKKASGTENCNSSNRYSSKLCINECGSQVSCKGNMCLTCAEAQGLSTGNVTGQSRANSKAYKGIRRDAAIAAAAEYESLHSNFDNSSRAQARLLLWRQPVSQSS
jgi:hypothetical protein